MPSAGADGSLTELAGLYETLGSASSSSAMVLLMHSVTAATIAAVTWMALTATGGPGFTPAVAIERHLRNARSGVVRAPTNAVLSGWIGKALFGPPVL